MNGKNWVRFHRIKNDFFLENRNVGDFHFSQLFSNSFSADVAHVRLNVSTF